MTAKRVRWHCPNGCAAVLGPQRPRRDNTCRYCLACSEKAGRLVERKALALEKKSAAKSEAARLKARAKRERERAREVERWTVGGVDMVRVIALALKLPSLEPAQPWLKHVHNWTLYRRKNPNWTTGRTDGYSVHLSIGIGGDPAKAVGVILHEIAHVACKHSREPWGDSDRAFARRCLDAHDEWNARHGHIVTVDRDGRGSPYRGEARKRRDRRREAAKT